MIKLNATITAVGGYIPEYVLTNKILETMVETNDGFKIAEEDMQMRGPGDLYGTKQSGILKFRLADILVDKDILEETRTEALKVVKEDPNIENPQNELLRQLLKENDYQSHWSKIS